MLAESRGVLIFEWLQEGVHGKGALLLLSLHDVGIDGEGCLGSRIINLRPGVRLERD